MSSTLEEDSKKRSREEVCDIQMNDNGGEGEIKRTTGDLHVRSTSSSSIEMGKQMAGVVIVEEGSTSQEDAMGVHSAEEEIDLSAEQKTPAAVAAAAAPLSGASDSPALPSSSRVSLNVPPHEPSLDGLTRALASKSIAQLRRLAMNYNSDISGCVEKNEIVDLIAKSMVNSAGST